MCIENYIFSKVKQQKRKEENKKELEDYQLHLKKELNDKLKQVLLLLNKNDV